MAVATVVVIARDDRSSPTRVIAPAPGVKGPSAAEIAGYRWSALPKAPIAGRTGAATVWTGKEMIVWGGSSRAAHERFWRDGAAYNPRTRQWRKLPRSPLAARVRTVAVWTGQEMVVWGGVGNRGVVTDGAAYDPRGNSWRRLPKPPFRFAYSFDAAWTGHEVLFVSGSDDSNDYRPMRAAAYDPRTDRWRVLPRPPDASVHDVVMPLVVRTRSRVLVLSAGFDVAGPRFHADAQGAHLAEYRPPTGRWRRLGVPDVVPTRLDTALWTGHDLVLFGAHQVSGSYGPAPDPYGVRYTPSTGAWRRIGAGPLVASLPTYVWTGLALLAVDAQPDPIGSGSEVLPGDGAGLGPRHRRVDAAPRDPSRGRNGQVDRLDGAGAARLGHPDPGPRRCRRPPPRALTPGPGSRTG